jgi:O-antigen/teichoic acid export membrane protein
MRNKLISSNSFTYLLMNIFNKGIVFFMIPLFLLYLGIDSYGDYNLIFSIVRILPAILTIGILANIEYIYLKCNQKNIQFIEKVLFTILLVSLFISLLGYILLDKNIYFFILLLLPFQIVLTYFSNFSFTHKKSRFMLIYTFIQNIGVLSLLFILNHSIQLEWLYYYFMINIIIFSIYFYKEIKLKSVIPNSIGFSSNKKLLIHSISILPHVIALFILNFFDKIIIKVKLDSFALGEYIIHYQMAFLIMMVVSAFNLSKSPDFTNNANKGLSNSILFLDKMKKQYLKLAFITLPTVFLFSYIYINYFAGIEFDFFIFLLLIFGVFFQVLYLPYSNFLYAVGESKLLSKVTVIASIGTIILSLFLVEYYLEIGVAIAFLFSNILLLILVKYNTIRFINES